AVSCFKACMKKRGIPFVCSVDC
uniref:2.39 kDa venom peptide n=1 Tax=Heterometrus spinifer TaxID=118530 RepID=VP239_HETSP|nr:RecName: Full=2.39 kDa venom peptide [Heterometrus spinifer]